MKLLELSEGRGAERDQENSINGFETNSKNNNITDLYKGINTFKKGHKSRTTLVTD
jgi:hypothetical protein